MPWPNMPRNSTTGARPRPHGGQADRRPRRDAIDVCSTAMREVPREAFVERFRGIRLRGRPAADRQGQTISQPYIVALMIEAAEVKPGERVLEIGAGSGYAAAVLSRIAGRVYTIERHAALAETAREAIGAASAIATSRCATATAPWAGRRRRRSMRSSWRRADRRFRRPCDGSSKIGGRLVIPVGALGTRATAREGRARRRERSSTRRISAPSCSCRWSASRAGRSGRAGDDVQAKHGRRRCVRARPPICCARRPSRCPISTIRHSADCSTGSRARAWCCSARRPTARRNSTARGRRSRAGSSSAHGFTIVAVEADWPDAAAIDRYVRHKAPSGGDRAAVPALSDLDVAQRRGARLRRLAARAQRRRRSGAPGRLLRARHLQYERLDRAPCSTISTRSIPKPPGWRASAMAA